MPNQFSRVFAVIVAFLALGCEKVQNLQEDVRIVLPITASKSSGASICEVTIESTRPELKIYEGTKIILQFPRGSQPLKQDEIKLRVGLDTVGNQSAISVALIGDYWFKIRSFSLDIGRKRAFIYLDWNDEHPDLQKIRYYNSPTENSLDWAAISSGVGGFHIDRSQFMGLISQRLSACTAFLIAPQVGVTNHHCLSDEKECGQGSVHFFTPRLKGLWMGSEDRSCKRILLTDEERDFTLFLLERPLPDRYRPIPLAKEDLALRENTPLEIISTNPIDQRRWRSCETEYRTLGISVTIDQALRSGLDVKDLCSVYSVKIKPCDIKAGDSGSPVLNFDGQLVGLLHSLNSDTARFSEDSQQLLPSGMFTPIDEIVKVSAMVLDAYKIPHAPVQ